MSSAIKSFIKMEDQLPSDTVTVRPIAVTKTARLQDKSAIPTPSAGTVPLDKVMHFLTTFAKEFREDMATTTKELLTAFDKRLSSVEDRLANAERELKELRTSNKKLVSEVSRCASGTSLTGGMPSGGESAISGIKKEVAKLSARLGDVIAQSTPNLAHSGIHFFFFFSPQYPLTCYSQWVQCY